VSDCSFAGNTGIHSQLVSYSTMKVGTFNLNGNGGESLMGWEGDAESFPLTSAFQKGVREKMEGDPRWTTMMIGKPPAWLKALPLDPNVGAKTVTMWLHKSFWDVYTDADIGQYRLVSMFVRKVQKFFPWFADSPPGDAELQAVLGTRTFLHPIPRKYDLPDDIQANSITLQAWAVYIFLMGMWAYVDLDELKGCKEEQKALADSYELRAIDQINDLLANHVDILLCQELPLNLRHLPLDGHFGVCVKGELGLSIYFPKGTEIIQIFEGVGYMLVDTGEYWVCNVHAQSGGGRDGYDICFNIIDKIRSRLKPIIIGGDFNTPTGTRIVSMKCVYIYMDLCV